MQKWLQFFPWLQRQPSPETTPAAKKDTADAGQTALKEQEAPSQTAASEAKKAPAQTAASGDHRAPAQTAASGNPKAPAQTAASEAKKAPAQTAAPKDQKPPAQATVPHKRRAHRRHPPLRPAPGRSTEMREETEGSARPVGTTSKALATRSPGPKRVQAAAVACTTMEVAGMPPAGVQGQRPASFPAPSLRRSPMPPLNHSVLQASLRLAHMTYTLDILPWMQDGWRDFSFQIDDVLESGRISTAQDPYFLQLANLKRLQRARNALNDRNPLVQLLAALRQRERSDTVKAVCMMRPLPDGRQLLAIGFMGTGKRFYDWFSNFRMGEEEGFHQGFYQLCRHFEQAADSITFPETALALGLPGLTLRDVLTDMRRPDSRFRLWMAGHSQGGAVMQIYTHRLMTLHGVLPGHISGYSFAAPTVASASLTAQPWAYPLWHIRNRDDVIGRVGATVHLGRLLDFAPDTAFRADSYQYSPLPADAAVRPWLMSWLDTMRNNESTLVSLAAMLLCIAQEKGEDVLGGFAERYRSVQGLDRLLSLADDQAHGLLRQLAERQLRTYRELTGQEMDPRRLQQRMDELRPHVRETPLRRILSVMGECLLQPHQLHGSEEAPGSYSMIVEQPLRKLIPLRWELRAGQPVRVRQSLSEPQGRSRRNAAVRRRAFTRRGKARLAR